MLLASANSVTTTAAATLPAVAAAGKYNVCVRAVDAKSNGSTPVCTSLVIYDPSALVAISGEGRVRVPAGNYASSATTASFEFEVKFEKKGSPVPSGQLQIELANDRLEFESNRIDGLVESDSPRRALIQGTGKMGDNIVCRFEADVYFKSFPPGNTDAFGLKITGCSNGKADFTLPPSPLISGSNRMGGDH